LEDTDIDEVDVEYQEGFAEAENVDVTVQGRKGVPLPSGPSKGIYHNPNTGQEFLLPNDPFNMEHYTKRHRLRHDPKKHGKGAWGVKFVYGPAPAELKAKWEQNGPERVDKDTSNEDQRSQETKDLTDMVKALSQQVAALQQQLSGEPQVDAYGIIEEEEVKEPEYELNTQIPMF
jgi:hypothetical protein